LRLVDLDVWYDVDDAASLSRLIEEVDSGVGNSDAAARFPAPATTAWLRQHRQRLAAIEKGARRDHAASAAQSAGPTCTAP
jgi:hypothetical protein